MSTSPFESARRAAKVRLLTEEIDRLADTIGLNARRDAVAIADLLGGFTARQWSELASSAGCNAPGKSGQTQREVIAVFTARAIRRAS